MNRWSKFAFAAALVVASTISSQAYALRIAIQHVDPVQGLAQSDVVVTGKVKEVEKNPVAIEAGKNSPKTEYSIAVIDIKDSIKGADSLTQIRVGFPIAVAQLIEPVPQPNLPRISGRPFRGGPQTPPLTVGQEGCFFLQKHPTGNFYLQVPYCTTLDAKAANFKAELAKVTDAVAVFKDPVKGLKEKDKKKRYANLQMLLQHYQSYPRVVGNPMPIKRVEVPAEESKIIMSMIADLPALTPDPDTGLNIQSMFYTLQPQASDGWKAPTPTPGMNYQKEFGEAAKKWATANADKFRVKRYEAK